MSAMADREADLTLTSQIMHSLHDVAQECGYLADGYRRDGDPESADFMDRAGLRYRQLLAVAPHAWADADRLDALTVRSSRDPETEACASQETQEIPRVH